MQERESKRCARKRAAAGGSVHEREQEVCTREKEVCIRERAGCVHRTGAGVHRTEAGVHWTGAGVHKELLPTRTRFEEGEH